ncbi:MAG TPA: class I SAM-dependent methyltransferase [Pyrinomonadaceae bacterium]|nr:class I SAM-dependent methyltransferase [Pyrinomonadaceae bacterium]
MALPGRRNSLKRAGLRLHKLGLHFGVQILPAHYYSPVPNIIELKNTQDDWARPSTMPGVDVDLDQQAASLKSICLPFQQEYSSNKVYLEAVSEKSGPGFGYIEAQCLYAVIRHLKPARVIEVGSGVSTWCTLAALGCNSNGSSAPGRLTSIEPHPSDRLRTLKEIELVEREVQRVPIEVFTSLQKGDLLFIDSSHTVKVDGDVNFLILEVLPRLRPGVVVHFHDIGFPYDYPRDTLRTFFHAMETSLLHAFLIFNERAKILFCLSQLHYQRTEVLQQVFPDYVHQDDERGLQREDAKPFESAAGHFPSSIYLQIQ